MSVRTLFGVETVDDVIAGCRAALDWHRAHDEANPPRRGEKRTPWVEVRADVLLALLTEDGAE